MIKPLPIILSSLFLLTAIIASSQICPTPIAERKQTIKMKEYVLRRELRTIPGELLNKPDSLKYNCNNVIPGKTFTREDLIRSQRELACLNYFYPDITDCVFTGALVKKQDTSQCYITTIVQQPELVCIGDIIKKIPTIIIDTESLLITSLICDCDEGELVVTNTINSMRLQPQKEDKKEITVTQVYPNPFTRTVNIEINDLPSEGALFNLYDISGKKVRQQKINNLRTNMTIGGLSSGTYIYQVVGERGRLISSGKLIKD